MGNYVAGPNRTAQSVRVQFTKTLFTKKPIVAGGTPKHSVQVLFDKSNAADMAFLKQLNQDAVNAVAEHWPNEADRPLIPFVGATDKNPIKDGDTAINQNGRLYNEKDEALKGHFFIRPTSTNDINVVDENNQVIVDPGKIYGGCYCDMAVNVYTYDVPKKGVTIGLNGARFSKDGERLGGGAPSVDDMFGDPAPAGANDPLNYSDNESVKSEPAASDDNPFG